MCGNLLRDGTSTATIPVNPPLCENSNCNTDREYGMHEDFYSYAHCRLRSRNQGLFTSIQVCGYWSLCRLLEANQRFFLEYTNIFEFWKKFKIDFKNFIFKNFYFYLACVRIAKN